MTLTVTQNTIQNNLKITQSNVVVKLQPVINASAQIVETDPIFQASEASNFVTGDKANLDNQSGINTGDETTSSIQTKRPIKTVNGESLEGSGNVQIDYNDLDNLPTIPTIITNHSELTFDDGTNPHGTTKEDVGLGNVPNLNTTNAVNNEHTHSNKTILDNTTESFITALKNVYDNAVSWITTNGTNLINHLTNTSNPHNVTKSQVGLGSVDNTSDADKPISTATQVALEGKLDKDTTSGVERAYIINADGSQGTKATSEFKDVLEFADFASFPTIGETDKIYVALDANSTYRWSGSTYVQIGGREIYIKNISVSGGYTIDFNVDTHRLTLIGNTTFSEINLPPVGFSKTITLHINGNFGIVLPASWTQYISGAYNGTATLNTIVIETIGTERKVQISQPD